jgi:hypothetical protein
MRPAREGVPLSAGAFVESKLVQRSGIYTGMRLPPDNGTTDCVLSPILS